MIDLLERVRSLVISEGLSAENEKPFLKNTLKVETAVYAQGTSPHTEDNPSVLPELTVRGRLTVALGTQNSFLCLNG